MPRRSLVIVALTSIVLMYAPAYAAVDDAGPGLICLFASVLDPTAEEGTHTGELSGGPLLLTDSTTGQPGSGTLVCRIQVNNNTHTGYGPFVAGHGTGGVGAGPMTVVYQAADTDTVSLCGEFIDDSDLTTYYWDDDNDEWSTSSAVSCGLAIGGTGGTSPATR